MKPKYTTEDAVRWLAKMDGGLTLREVADLEDIRPGVIAGAMNRARKRGEIPASKRKKGVKRGHPAKGPRLPARPDMKRPELDGPDIIALKKGQCKFPVTHDRPYKFCGAERENDKQPYCKHHNGLAHDNSDEHAARVDNALKWLTPA